MENEEKKGINWWKVALITLMIGILGVGVTLIPFIVSLANW